MIFRPMTMVYPIRCGQMMLGLKKVRLGKGYLVGPGGRLMPNEGLRQCAIRELAEESGLVARSRDLKKIAILKCNFPLGDEPHIINVVHIYLVRCFEGEPQESDEAKWAWYPLDRLPYERMFKSDRYYLPHALRGTKVVAEFSYDNNGKVILASMFLRRRDFRRRGAL